MKKMTGKTTVTGVKSQSTRVLFKELKKRGFTSSLEKGSKSTFKIICFINGVDFVISCVDGKQPLYSKNYSRGIRRWVEFNDIDELLLISMVKAESPPTEKQIAYFDNLIIDVKKATKSTVKIIYPTDVSGMMAAIDEVRWLLLELGSGCVTGHVGVYVHCESAKSCQEQSEK